MVNLCIVYNAMADDKKLSVFVTVGTTSFDQLIKTVSNDAVCQVIYDDILYPHFYLPYYYNL